MTTSLSNVTVFLDGLRADCVSVWPDGDKLHVWPASRLTSEQLDYLRANKAAVLAYLCRRNSDLLPPDEVCRAWRRRYANTGAAHHDLANFCYQHPHNEESMWSEEQITTEERTT